MQKAGQLVILTNEFNEKIGFYQICFVERDIRAISRNYKNAYCVVMAACQMEVFNLNLHSGGFKSKFDALGRRSVREIVGLQGQHMLAAAQIED